jgi:chaperonin GroEL
MAKQIIFDDSAREKLFTGIETLAKTVSVTLGPCGRNVILEKSFGAPVITKDGVSVAKDVDLEDAFENLGAKLVQEVASKTNDQAGDGTTTATVLAADLVRQGLRHMVSGASPTLLRRGIDMGVKAAASEIDSISKDVSGREDVARVGTISANQDQEIGSILADAVEKVGEDGVITVEEGDGLETTLNLVDGMNFDKGYISPYFVTDTAKMISELESPLILVHEGKISNLQEFLPLLEQAAPTSKPLLIISEDVEGEALAALVVNKMRGIMNVVAVKAPGFGDRRKAMLEDIAISTGAKAIMNDQGEALSDVQLEDLGTAKKVIVEKERCIIINGKGDKQNIADRVGQIKAQLERSTSTYDQEKLQERLARLAGGVAVIKVGGATEAELKQRKHRVEDALHATRAAKSEGIVPGGGTALLRAIPAVKSLHDEAKGDEKLGINIVLAALSAPTRTIADNAGYDGNVVVDEVSKLKGWNGFDALENKYCDLGESGIIDPKKVVRSALVNAGAIAGLILTTNTLVTDAPKENADVAD